MKSSRVSALIFIGFILSNNIFSESASANSGSKYKSAQFIGFSLNTGPSSSEAQCRALGKEKPCYVGLKNNIEDVEGRAEIMKKAVELAYKNAEKSSRTLKVFIAPEFYWRGTGGAYPVSSIFDGARPGEKNTINQIGRELESIVSDKRFNDWLFVFGTVIAVNDLVPDDVLENVPGKQRLFYNFSPMYKGGVVRFGKNFIIPKRYISHIDFLKDPVNTDEFTYLSDGTKQYDTELWSQLKEWISTEKDYKIIENNWFRINNL